MSTVISSHSKVTILLSTYNGSNYLQQQLDSLYGQTYPDIRILVRDDGSLDSTMAILENERAKGHIEILKGRHNMGVAPSFFELLKNAVISETEYVAFCDQDDIWYPEKIARAVSQLSGVADDRPAMYCSRVELVDETLQHIGFTKAPGKIGFGNALVESIATGCTIVLNKHAAILIANNLPKRVVVHDWWCYLVVSCFGDVIFDAQATLKYRQHAGNAIGVATNAFTRLVRKYRRFFGAGAGHQWISQQALSLRDIFSSRVPQFNSQLLNLFLGSKSILSRRIQLALSGDIWRQSLYDDLMLRLLILINRF